MSVQLKPIEEQVVVVAGASSGIGLSTAGMAAERGAKVVLAARSEDALEDATEQIRREGGDAVSVVADVRDREDVREIVRVAQREYGGFDTWVNVASVFIYGRLDETPVEDMREQFDTNVWGMLNGSLEAADHLKHRGGGSIITIGSIASDRAIPLQGSYSASKHAVKGFTDALRMELEEEDAPVSVSLIKPAAIDTPYPEHAKNYMDDEASLPPPVYAPETVARAVIHAAEHGDREPFVGGAGKVMTAMGRYAPNLTDRFMERTFFDSQRRDRPPRPLDENSLDRPSGDSEERGGYEGYVAERSLYTRVAQRWSSVRGVAAVVGVAAATAYAISKLSGRGDEDERWTDIELDDQRETRPGPLRK